MKLLERLKHAREQARACRQCRAVCRAQCGGVRRAPLRLFVLSDKRPCDALAIFARFVVECCFTSESLG